MTSQTLRGWKPKTPNSFARPVQDEDATGGLSGCQTPDGHGVLLWNMGTGIHFAIVDSVQDFLVDDVVPSGDIQVADSGIDSVHGCSIFLGPDDELYYVTHQHDANTCYVLLRVADDPNAPTSWSTKATVHTEHAGGPVFGNSNGIGTPLILDSGRWVLGTKVCGGPVDNTFQAVAVEVHTSDNNGSTWSERMHFEHPNIFPRTEFLATTMAMDPGTGFVWWRSGTSISATDQNNLWRSDTVAEAWAHSTSDVTAQQHNPALDNGVNIYSFTQTGGHIYVYDGSGFDFTDWTDTGEDWAAPGVSLDAAYTHTVRALVAAHGVFAFVRDQVMFIRAGGWHVGYVGT